MRPDFLPFSRPSISEADIDAVNAVLRSGWITTGSKAAEFEKNFSSYVGCPDAVAVSSATAAMHLLLQAMGIGPGDEVITPSMTWVSTINLIILRGAVPVFVDIDKDTLMVSAEAIKERITERTRLIIPVHFAGAAVDLTPIRRIAKQNNIFVVEDAAHAVGTGYKGARIGKTGTSIFSFHPIKNITTGEGGMFCSDNPDLLKRIRRLKFHGLDVDGYDGDTPGRPLHAEVTEPGYKYNMPDILAALGIMQLRRIEEFNRKRTELAMRYRGQLASVPEIVPLADPAYPITHSWHLFIVRLDTDKTGLDRDALMERLKERNVGTGLHFRAVHLQKYYRETMPEYPGKLPHTEWNSQRICSLPLFPDMKIEDVDNVVEALKAVLSRGKGKK
ncbi:MAG: aminotransferase class I/II-fold pyridoxal phosphate-dependent enzyme [Candidatus Omnitrophica bacterium]|nr:aminotransferase class I/II-fold pyridoxal phosphate-dependent enzyme [Candidatus Omnitrophota bacterium]